MFRSYGRIPYILFYFNIFFLSFGGSLSAEGKSFIYYIEWTEVKGSRGYVVEVRKAEPPQDLVVEKKVTENEIEFSLEAGVYEYRIAGLNRFGKPSSYTPWTNFKVEQDRPKAVALAEKEEAAAKISKGTSHFVWIPGTGFYSKGERNKAYGIWAGFAVLAYLGNSEREAGNRLASKSLNDPKMIGLLGLNLPTQATLYLWQSREKDKHQYEIHQQNQVVLGGLTILGVALSLWLENRLPSGDSVQVKVRPDVMGLGNGSMFTGLSQSRWDLQYSRSF
ncbi:fibronectin type III domain-containing protein [Leptospira langatensis]|uniref:Fibronectin type III domain-containing protein n=1 Tax=Leptospira langatensis TaxID=2484983 RepID=A0A5F1ZRS6_9LEPT|nr:fibronectin type III domain-containing protein [Leptospira langatensis]TGJ98806.1 fibronectin type III domain-containing protein [Leptospira langatensis]TGL40627.1 fibronectin type III domain-containing protein [Leptospira langatensis]